MRVEDFDFDLPAELIAQAPVYPREAAKLLHVSASGRRDETFGSIASVLRPGDLLVFNRSRVIPARLFGVRHRGETEAQVETTLTVQLAPDTWTTFSKLQRLAVGDSIDYGQGLTEDLSKDGLEVTVQFNQSGDAL